MSARGTNTQEGKLVDLDETPRRVAVPRLSVLLLGLTGVGKSSFIARTTGADVEIGHGIDSCTVECNPVTVDYLKQTRITLIDTPGFDDTKRDDMDILRDIASFITADNTPPVGGIIYFQRITDRKVTGLGRMNLKLMQAICGPAFYPNVVLCTTMWDTISNDQALYEQCVARETELTQSANHWGELIHQGCPYYRFEGDRESGRTILDHILGAPPAPRLDIERELRAGRRLEETVAASIILEERHRREDRLREEMKLEQEEEEERLREERERLARVRDARDPVRSYSHHDRNRRVQTNAPNPADPRYREDSSHESWPRSGARLMRRRSSTDDGPVVEIVWMRRSRAPRDERGSSSWWQSWRRD